ncbi:hypothetical protein BIY23_02480 [Wolbachia pipientis]|uniref:Uncharacterized protein n=1 Tax=Wolbachia pipientis TaxID=955 RepID=A0A1E7QJP9_WOLPI|nr:hypothetical protein [Wolbachia pipientis]OEY86702.1 hypothetical protein BIY23_02480 [Wolbachia pipientis]
MNIALHFEIEKGGPIDSCYFSARIKFTDKSKNELRDKLGDSIDFNNLDNYFDLNSDNFYIYYNKYASRSELYIKDGDGNYLKCNLPLNRYLFSVELSSSESDSTIIDYGFYPQHSIYNPHDHIKEKVFNDEGKKLLPVTLNILENLLSNTDNLTVSDISSQFHNKIALEEAHTVRTKRDAEEKLIIENAELESLIKNDQIILLKVIKGQDIDDKRITAVLQASNTDKFITLDPQKYYIEKYDGEEYLLCREDGSVYMQSSEQHMYMPYDSTFFVLNNNSYHYLKSGFYSIHNGHYVEYLNDAGHYLTDDELPEKILNTLKNDDLQDREEAEQEKISETYNHSSPHDKSKQENVNDDHTEGLYNNEESHKKLLESDDARNIESTNKEEITETYSQSPSDDNNRKKDDNYSNKEALYDEEKIMDFFQAKHPDVLEKLIGTLSQYSNNSLQYTKLIKDFVHNLKNYEVELSQWLHNTEDQQQRGKRSVEVDTIAIEKTEEEVIISVIKGMDTVDVKTEHPSKISIGDPLDMGKYKVELKVTYNDILTLYNNAIYDKYQTQKAYNYEQTKVLYDQLAHIIPLSGHAEKLITLPEAYITNGHLFIQNYDFGSINEFNEMFYKHSELL